MSLPAEFGSFSLEEAKRFARAHVRTADDLTRFLGGLEAKAKEQQVVTQLEMASGIAAIEAVHGRAGADVIRREVSTFRENMIAHSRTLAAARDP